MKEYVEDNESKEKLEEMLGDTGAVLNSTLEYLNHFQNASKDSPETVQLL